MRTRIGIAGCGHLGKIHTKMHTMLSDISELIGVYDINSEAVKTASELYNCKGFDNLDEMISQVDGVVVAVATQAHYEVAKKCLIAGKHVFIEKPITATVEQGRELVEMAKEKGLIIQVGQIERYNPAFSQLKNFEIEPKFIEAHRLATFNPRGADVSVVLDLMIHDIDLILSLIKSDIERIDAAGVAVITDTADIANVRIKFKNGAVANLTASRMSLKKMRKFRIFQKEKYLSLDLDTGIADIFYLADKDAEIKDGMAVGNLDYVNKKIVYSKKEKVEVNALLEENRDFVESISKGKPVKVTGKDGLKALEVADKILSEIANQFKENN
ncbi:MAG: Gfo/Idh/MocA family oxidoreductase [Candidatus Delongbacteria bacterium]|nr:Gfo/Idh/MocA family oxidoreductase [Candidatus Delongbacteria bacterium]